ncbi:PCNA-associated factor-like isoform X2 [Mercenaria mercenaria]|uniref:PCNA-associated factor-like isoform X2 n=1 Tax=Mercenaria mercenaria TaxID=6596 RepID=UPI001E1DAD36|nr:PCNA-associated factor-like isoform X2 [Mercenaria mercenaria]
MVRTKADAGCSSGSRKAIGGNAPRKALGGAGPSSAGASPSGKAAGKYAGGNPVCPRPTPEWQKGIGGFFTQPDISDKENTEPTVSDTSKAGSSKDVEACSSKDVEAGSSKDVEAGSSKDS